jgi:hypothetical protein
MQTVRSEPHGDVFLLVLKALEDAGVLKEFVLVGSWCLLLYRQHFGGSDLIPAVRTTDVDLLLLRPSKHMKETDVPKALAGAGFLEQLGLLNGYSKFNREGFIVEFLAPLRGDGQEMIQKVKPLRITVQGLRHLNYQAEELITLNYHGVAVRVPRPELYTLFKFIVHEERKNPVKMEKDLATAQQMAIFLMESEEGRAGLKWALSRLTKGQRLTVLRIVAEKAPQLGRLYKSE